MLQPLGDHLRYDLAYYSEETKELVRIQCKAGRYDPKIGCVFFKNFNRSGGRTGRRGYVGDAEYFGVYCAELDTVYLVPVDIVSYASEVPLRVNQAKNNQEKKIIWARNYEVKLAPRSHRETGKESIQHRRALGKRLRVIAMKRRDQV